MKTTHLVLLFLFLFVGCKEERMVSIDTLLQEMVDREQLTRYPAPYYTCAQFSSYDRTTTTPDDKSWFANWDRSMFIRSEINNSRKEHVMMDAQGPGAIIRFWMTFSGENCGKGTLRIYLDNDTVPVVEGAALDVLSNHLLVGAPLSTSVSDQTDYTMRGHNLYFPIPYAKACKVTYESDNVGSAGAKERGEESVYYNINYRTYTDDTKVITYSKEELQKAKATLDRVQQELEYRYDGLDKLSLAKTSFAPNTTISPGSEITITINAAHAIRELTFSIDAKNMEQALRSTILEIAFDGKKSVWTPIGDFFGTGYQIRSLHTWYSKVKEDGTMSSLWVMPFKKDCRLTIKNFSSEVVTIKTGEVVSAPYKWNNRSMYFGSYWHQFTNLKTGEMKNNEGDGGPFDINYVTLNGKGVYVGDGITLFNTVYAWWGEGDEKVYVDGETFPSHIGTGTEDYYGYAWCRPEKFSNHPFIAQPDGSGNFDPGYTVNLRYRSLDAIPFSKSLRFDMEMWHWTRAVINFAPVTYYYTLPESVNDLTEDMEGAKAAVTLNRTDIISPNLIGNKIEGENLVFQGATGGRFRYQNDVTKGWSDNMQLFWTGAKRGDKLDLSFNAEKSFYGTLKFVVTCAPDYGKYRILLNAKPLKVFDGYSPDLRLELINIENTFISKGENILSVEVLSERNNADKTAFFGLDYLMIE